MATGTVVGATKIVDHGADIDHFVLAIVAEGFTSTEQTTFESAVAALLADLQASAPYSETAVWNRFNVYRLDVHSNESGADNPLSCPDDPAGYTPDPPAVADTRYGATFCWNNLRRLIGLTEEAQLLTDLDDHVSSWDAAIVVVNHSEYGGSGNSATGIATHSLDPLATQIAIHELGHVLGLADEYDGGGTYAGADPSEPNVTTSASGTKWATHITTANLPTWSSTNCAMSNLGSVDPEPGAVGAYEGARYFNCGLYRPTHDCLMRTLSIPNCVVCKEQIRTFLGAPFHTPPSGCFVASAIYGDPRHPDVETLRAFRDRHLRAGARGRLAMTALAAAYDRVGPVLARLAAPRPRLSRAFRRAIFEPTARALRRPSAGARTPPPARTDREPR